MGHSRCAIDSPGNPGAPAVYNGEEVELSVVLPLYDEAEIVRLTYRRLKAVMASMEISHELLFVDDGSRDGTAAALSGMALGDPSVTAVFLAGHYGKESALAAGLAQARGRAVIIMDADLQDPPELIPRMLAAWREGAEVVLMRRRPKTGGSMLQRMGRQGLDCMLDSIGDIGMPESSVDFMLYSRRALAALSLLVHRKRYMKPMLSWVGLRETVIEYERQPRVAGSSKWSLLEFLGRAPDGSIAYLHMLLRTLMLLGLAGVPASLACACYNLAKAAILGGPPDTGSLAASMWALPWAGLMYFSGWTGKYIIQISPPARRPAYSIRELVRFRANSSL